MKPEIRFSGYNDEWVEKRLGDVVGKIQSGNRLPKSSLIDGDVPYVVAQTKNDGVLKKIARGTLDYNGNLMKLFPGNSISFSIDNPDAMFYRNAEFYTSNIMRVIHEDHLTHEQYVFILENMKRFTKGYDWTHKFSGPVVSNLEYPQPSKEEQQKIGALFSKYDTIIALREQKLEELNALKKGLLQQMFPKNGAKVPELRFERFMDDWEERKLKDLAQFNPKTVLPDEFEYVDLESVIGTKMISHRTESKNQAPSRAQRLAKKGDVFYQTVRPYQMNNYLYDLPYDDYVFSTGYTQMRPNIDSYFLLNSVQNKQFVKHVLDRCTGTSYPAINSSDLSNIKIYVPASLPEQQKIGQLFKHLDTRIANEQTKIEQLKAQKQGLLQRML